MTHNHPHPGEVLRKDVLAPLNISVTEASRRLGVSRVALSRVLHGHSGIGADLALRLERAGAGSARFWMFLQANYELSLALLREQPSVLPLHSPLSECLLVSQADLADTTLQQFMDDALADIDGWTARRAATL